MRKTVLAALLCSAALTLPLQVTPVLLPGVATAGDSTFGYTDAQLNGVNGDPLSGLNPHRGSTLDSIFARPEYGFWGKNADRNVPEARPILHWISPSVTDTFFGLDGQDFRIQVAAFGAGHDGIKDGISKVEFYANGVMCAVTQLTAIKVPLSASQGGGYRMLPGYEVVLPFGMIPDKTRIKLYAKAYSSIGLMPRTIGPMFLTRKAAFDRTITITNPTVAESNKLTTPDATSTFNKIKTALGAIATWTGAQTDITKDDHILINFASDVTEIDVSTMHITR